MTFPLLRILPAPPADCKLCPRLHDFLLEWRQKEPIWHNAPVAPFFPDEGEEAVRLLIVGLAPGLRGANRTGRPFTGDYAGELLYETLKIHGFAKGTYQSRPDDNLRLVETAIANAVRCVPPQNKPIGAEINTCRRYLTPLLMHLPQLCVVVTLGAIAHQSTIRALGAPLSHHPFGHGHHYKIGRLHILSSYHCSRYNTNTKVLTEVMFHDIFAAARAHLDAHPIKADSAS